MHTEELQRSFENMKQVMRENQAKLERQLKAKRRECLQKDEEIARLLQHHSGSALSMAEFRDTVSELEAKAAGEKAALKSAHKETKHRLEYCETALNQMRADLAHRESRLKGSEEEIATLKQRLERLTDSHEATLGELRRRENAIAQLEDEISQLQNSNQQMSNRLQNLVAELDIKIAELNQTKTEMHELQVQHRELTRLSEDHANEARRASEKANKLGQQVGSGLMV